MSVHLMPARDSQAVAAIIGRVVRDPAEAATVAEAVRAAAVGPAWERDAGPVLATYREATSGTSGRDAE